MLIDCKSVLLVSSLRVLIGELHILFFSFFVQKKFLPAQKIFFFFSIPKVGGAAIKVEFSFLLNTYSSDDNFQMLHFLRILGSFPQQGFNAIGIVRPVTV